MNLAYQQRFPWNLDWNLLRTFMVVVEQRGISKAAEFLGLKQPTVSAALKRLEETTGQCLIIRKPNEFSVTRSGQLLYSECATIFGAISQLPARMKAEGTELRGHLSIAITSSVISKHFDDFLNDFSTAHPNVTYSFMVSDSSEVENIVSQNRASLGICLLSKMPRNLETFVLYREFFGLFCGSRHPLFHADTVSTDDLRGEPFVAFHTEDEGGPLEAVAQLRTRFGLATNWRGISSSLNEIRRMIMANIGIGALPLHITHQDVAAGIIRQLPPYEDLPMVNIYMLNNPARRLSDAESTFIAACKTTLAEFPIEDRTYGPG